LLQAISEWSIVYAMSFEPVKMNKTCYTTVCGADDNGGGKECLWRLHASILKNSSEYFKIRSFVREHTSYISILQSSHR